jgi:hypothetical protein
MREDREPSTESCNFSVTLLWYYLDKITYLCLQVHPTLDYYGADTPLLVEKRKNAVTSGEST